MKRSLMHLWQKMFRRLGRPGIAAVALLLGAVLMMTWIPRLNSQGEQLRGVIAAKAAAAKPGHSLPRQQPAGEQVGELVAVFPPVAQSPNDLDEVFQSAKRRNVTLLKGEYQFKQDPQAPLVIYTATFPVQTGYSAIKDFATDVLRALPNASMDELRMTRNDAGSPVLESVIRFTFVYRGV